MRTCKCLLVVSLLLASGGCRGRAPSGDDGLMLEVAISPTPPAVGTAHLSITLRDTTGANLENARIVVRGDMTHAGMTPVVDTAIAEGTGRYAVPDFRFTMAGDWILTLTATLPDGREASLEKNITVVTLMPHGPER